MLDTENERLRDIYRNKNVGDTPKPWKEVLCDISGITAVGFAPGTEYLLILTHSGLGVFDCVLEKVVARQVEDDIDDPCPVKAKGIGPLAGIEVSLAGLWGGGMHTMTVDGWVIHKIAPDWPEESVVLCPPDNPEIDDDPLNSILLRKNLDPGVRAMGFSDSGRTLVVTTTDLYIWKR